MILERINPRVVEPGGSPGLAAELEGGFPGAHPATWLRLDRLYPEEVGALVDALGPAAVRTSVDPFTTELRALVAAPPAELHPELRRLEGDPMAREVAFAVRKVLEDRGRVPRRLRVARGGEIDLARRPVIMGVLNVTPDSFSDGGRWLDPRAAAGRAREMAAQGALIVDVGGQSTRPGAEDVSESEELARVLPVIRELAGEGFPVPISIDTWRSEVAARALEAGASIVNDVTGLAGDLDLASVVAEAGAGVVVMHMQGTPKTMQLEPRYRDLMAEVTAVLREGVHLAERSGVHPEAIAVDPGIGFGKSLENNVEILRRLSEFRSLGRPIAVGTSRKSFLGTLTGKPVGERLFATAASVALAVRAGAAIVRVHDVAEMIDVVATAAAWREDPA